MPGSRHEAAGRSHHAGAGRGGLRDDGFANTGVVKGVKIFKADLVRNEQAVFFIQKQHTYGQPLDQAFQPFLLGL